MTEKDWATLAIAILGAATGLFSLGWNVATYLLRDRPRLTLRTSWGYGNLPHMGEGHVVSITAVNEARHAVIVESVGLTSPTVGNCCSLSAPRIPRLTRSVLAGNMRPGPSWRAFASRS